MTMLHKPFFELQLFKRQQRREELKAFINTATLVIQNATGADRERYSQLPIGGLKRLEAQHVQAIESLKQTLNRCRR